MCEKSNPLNPGQAQGQGVARGGYGFAGQAQPADGVALFSAVHPIQRSPLFVHILLDLYVNPGCATSKYYGSHPGNPQRAAMDELVKEGILEVGGPAEDGIVKVREPEALRLYAEAVGKVQLPRKKWVMP